MKKIRLRAINIPEGFISRWIEYEVEEIPELTQELLHPCLNLYPKEGDGIVSKEEVLRVFDKAFVAWNKLHRYPTTFKNHFRKALEEMP